ncbi:MAG: DUF1559 domain-containing protein, partial [Planctomycetota bacterium]
AANRMSCTNNLKQFGIALQSFHDVYNKFPVGETGTTNRQWGWGVTTLPYIEQTALYTSITSTDTSVVILVPGGGPNSYNGTAFNSDTNAGLPAGRSCVISTTATSAAYASGAKTQIKTFICPSDVWPAVTTTGGFGKSNYLASMGNLITTANAAMALNSNGSIMNGVLVPANDAVNSYANNIAAIIDGTSNTILLGEVAAQRISTTYGLAAASTPIWAGGNPNLGGASTPQNYFRATGGLNGTLYPINSTLSAASMDLSFNSSHSGGANFLLGDASVKFISSSVDPIAYAAAGSKAGGETAALP